VHIILVSDRLATAKSLTLTGWHVFFAGATVLVSIVLLASAFSYLTVRHAAEIRLPFLQDLLHAMNAEESQRSKAFVRENLNVMATKLGELQAQLLRLDTVGARLAAMAGIKPQEIKAVETRSDGRGGPLVLPSATMSPAELQQAVDELSRQLETKSDTIALIEAQLLEDRIRSNQLPTSLPVNAEWNASAYGWRIDPFTGERAMHEGVDFVAATGTAISAAAAGMVISAEFHPEYGNLVEIDHGNDFTTRYAHASRLWVKAGQLVMRGQKIAEVGTTGRSTGPHLHFEVRMKGMAQNPGRFLRLAQNQLAPGTGALALQNH
jgi:murein DD-endopeptidase MepM/ murein hydrolase activator NlpD